MAKVIIVSVLVLAIGLQASSAEDVSTEFRRNALHTACAPMALVVDLEPESSAKEIGLTKQAIINAAASRLRGARLFASFEEQTLSLQYLHLVVAMHDSAYVANLYLKRYLDDLGFGMPGIATGWSTGNVGLHGGNAQYLLGIVSEFFDNFLASYLRVNEAYCSR